MHAMDTQHVGGSPRSFLVTHPLAAFFTHQTWAERPNHSGWYACLCPPLSWLLQTPASDIAFVPNATTALNAVLHSVQLAEGVPVLFAPGFQTSGSFPQDGTNLDGWSWIISGAWVRASEGQPLGNSGIKSRQQHPGWDSVDISISPPFTNFSNKFASQTNAFSNLTCTGSFAPPPMVSAAAGPQCRPSSIPLVCLWGGGYF